MRARILRLMCGLSVVADQPAIAPYLHSYTSQPTERNKNRSVCHVNGTPAKRIMRSGPCYMPAGSLYRLCTDPNVHRQLRFPREIPRFLVSGDGIEPPTRGFSILCSTD